MVSVVVRTYDQRIALETCLQRLFAQRFPPEHLEVIVVDDGSTDGTDTMMKNLVPPTDVKYLSLPHGGRAAAANAGARAAAGEVLLFLDADTWASERLVSSHARHFVNSPPVTVVGLTRTHPDARVNLFMQTRESYNLAEAALGRNLAPVFGGNNSSVRAGDFWAVGAFDEHFTGHGWEDVDLALRLHARGALLRFEPDAVADHMHVETLESVREKRRQGGRGAVYLWRKHNHSFRIGLSAEIHPFFLPLKWLVYRQGWITNLAWHLLRIAERRRIRPLLSLCYAHLTWDAYYEGVFASLRNGQVNREW